MKIDWVILCRFLCHILHIFERITDKNCTVSGSLRRLLPPLPIQCGYARTAPGDWHIMPSGDVKCLRRGRGRNFGLGLSLASRLVSYTTIGQVSGLGSVRLKVTISGDDVENASYSRTVVGFQANFVWKWTRHVDEPT